MFDLSWEILNSEIQDICKYLGRFPQAPILWRMVERIKQVEVIEYPEFGTYDQNALLKARLKLVSLNLLKSNNISTYRLHPLTREFFRNKITKEEFQVLGDINV